MTVKNNIIIFGAGYYGKNVYWKLKEQYNFICFVDNNPDIQGTFFEGIPIISRDELGKISMDDKDIIICTRSYYQIVSLLFDMGIFNCYVMLEGFLYHTDRKETMMPVELTSIPYYRKRSKEKNILFIQNAACIRTHKLAELMKEEGYKIFLLYTLAPPFGAYGDFVDIYDEVWGFSSANGILDFISKSDFDVIHCSNEPDILVTIAQKSNKPVIADTHDMESIRKDVGIETLILEYLANTKSDGGLHVSERIANIARNKYGLKEQKQLVIGNLVMYKAFHTDAYLKLSFSDHEIHCVYEGGVVGEDRKHHRFFDDMWRKIVETGIHIHFYSPSDLAYCKRLEKISPFIHYEGNLSGDKLIYEMTKYDCGLAVFNSVADNRLHLEAASINKIYEYISAGLPVISSGIKSLGEMLEKYHIGMELNFSKNIREQITNACRIKIGKDFLVQNGFTMQAHAKELKEFYEQVKES